MNAGVPITMPVCVLRAFSSRKRAMPKSSTLSWSFLREEQVLGLEIAVDDRLLVRRFEHSQRLIDDVERLVHGSRPPLFSALASTDSPCSSSITR